MAKCFIDGDLLCIVGEKFVNLQESESLFIVITEKERRKIEELE